MGVQLVVKRSVMVEAGWTVSEKVESYPPQCGCDEGGHCDCPWSEIRRAVFTKGLYNLGSYSPTDLVMDCNIWGTNRKLAETLGLLDLPHRLI